MDRRFGYPSTNVTGTLGNLEHCRGHEIGHFVFASSSGVCGPEWQVPESA